VDKHRDRQFVVEGKAARAAAYARPSTRCRDCKLTIAERRATHPKARWHWGHPRHPWTDYGIECDHCNMADGGRIATGTHHFDASIIA